MEKFIAICKNPWCKSHFEYTEEDMIIIEGVATVPKQCFKCISFNDDLSDGIEWEDREYDGERFDNKPHIIKYSVTKYV